MWEIHETLSPAVLQLWRLDLISGLLRCSDVPCPYLRFSLSYRGVEELLAERVLHADHVTVWRWVQHYAPEMDRHHQHRRRKDELASGHIEIADNADLVLIAPATADILAKLATVSPMTL